MHHVDAPERVTRALGVYEWTGELNKPNAARFVPVSLFINGTMQDAGLYLARPVPFALGTGDVYSLERAGEPQGLLDLDFAQHVVANGAGNDEDTVSAWYGYGRFTPRAPLKEANLHPSARLAVIQSDGKSAETPDDNRPHMTRRSDTSAPATSGGDAKQTGPDASSKTGAKSDGAGTTTSNAPSGNGSTTADSDDTDRPTLRHRDPSQDATRKREYGTKSKQASVTAVGPGPGDDPDRPMLGRNTDADAGIPPLTGLPADMHQTVGISDPVHRDTHNFARSWDTPAERILTLSSLEAAARPRVLAYLAANHLSPSSGPLPPEGTASMPASEQTNTPGNKAVAASAAADASDTVDPATPPRLQRGVPSQYQSSTAAGTAAAGASSAPPKAAAPALPPSTSRNTTPPSNHAAGNRGSRPRTILPPSLTLAQPSLTGYTLSYGGLPTFIYTAAAPVTVSHPAPPKTTTPAPVSAHGAPAVPVSVNTTHVAVFVTVVAQRLPSGELQVVLSSVTDSLHLDRSPRLRLIDAADPDGSHRASLLFELRGASSRQFALYRLTAAQAEQTFTTASIE